jgi:outer membrane protein assembly factor BamD
MSFARRSRALLVRRPSDALRMVTRPLITSTLLIVILLLAGCSGSGRLRYASPQEAFEKGKALYEDEKYTRAIEYLQGTFDYGRAHEWADDAQLFLARAYRANKQYILAVNEYTRFVEIYRNDPRVPEAEYERALTYYERSPSYELDQTPTKEAIRYFQLFLNRYPGSERADDAEANIAELRDKLARKQYDAAQLYERRGLFEAAAVSFERVFDQYPDTRWADEALVGAMRNYIAFAAQSVRAKQAERYEKAVANYERLIQIFPESPELKQAEALYEQAATQLEALRDEEVAQG